MPRKKKESPAAKKKAAAPPAPTYHKAKNGRFYKKVQIDGKMRVRFVSSAEANGHLSSSKTKPTKTTKPTKPKKPRAKRKPRKKSEEDVVSVDDEKE